MVKNLLPPRILVLSLAASSIAVLASTSAFARLSLSDLAQQIQDLQNGVREMTPRLGDSTATCDATTQGLLRWNAAGAVVEVCDGTAWFALPGDSRVTDLEAAVCDLYAATGATPAPSYCGVNHKLVFVTNQIFYAGSLGGLYGADSACQSAANTAGLPGTYRAWLSTTYSSPATTFAQNSGPYELVNGTRIANNWADLVDGSLLAPINRTEMGVSVGGTYVWTGTRSDGTLNSSSYTCLNWSSSSGGGTVGYTATNGSGWSLSSQRNCNGTARLYCVQQ